MELADLYQSAIVFAPHPDDESLGCGGTILRKRFLGAEVAVIFLTDGRASPRQGISEELMASIRMNEALDACRALKVSLNRTYFLGIHDGQLSRERALAVRSVLSVLYDLEPEQVFVPYRWDPHSDHVAANLAVQEALRAWERDTTVYEYPIWFWNHWPWADLCTASLRETARSVATAFRRWSHLLTHINCKVAVESVEEQKKKAWNSHRSQAQTVPRFFDCFFRGWEFFYRYRFHSVSS